MRQAADRPTTTTPLRRSTHTRLRPSHPRLRPTHLRQEPLDDGNVDRLAEQLLAATSGRGGGHTYAWAWQQYRALVLPAGDTCAAALWPRQAILELQFPPDVRRILGKQREVEAALRRLQAVHAGPSADASWALQMVLSRSLFFPDQGRLLCPLLDLFNTRWLLPPCSTTKKEATDCLPLAARRLKGTGLGPHMRLTAHLPSAPFLDFVRLFVARRPESPAFQVRC